MRVHMVGSGMEIPHAAVVLSNLQSLLERFTGGVLVLVESVGVDIQRGRGLGMPQQSRYRRNICAVGDEKAGVAVPLRYNYDNTQKSSNCNGYKEFERCCYPFSKPKNTL